jgi:hypothetical protein
MRFGINLSVGMRIFCLVIGLLMERVRSIARAESIVKQTYGWMGWEARQDLLALASFLPAKAVIGVTDQMAGAVMLYVHRDTFRPGSMVRVNEEFNTLVTVARAGDHPIYLLGDLDCPHDYPADARLPDWLTTYPLDFTGRVIRGIPFGCQQKVYRLITQD